MAISGNDKGKQARKQGNKEEKGGVVTKQEKKSKGIEKERKQKK